MQPKIIRALPGEHCLKDYQQAYDTVNFDALAREFYGEAKRVNLAHRILEYNIERGLGEQVALYFDADQRQESYTFDQLNRQVNRFANVLVQEGLQRGDRLAIFMPRCPEWYISFLAAAKKGIIVVPLFEAFMEDAVVERLQNSGARGVVTTGDLLSRVPRQELPGLKKVFVTRSTGVPEGEDVLDWHQLVAAAAPETQCCWLTREDPLFILYAAGADGRPKGLLHVHDIMLGLWSTATWVHDLKPGDVYWSTSDPGWITGIAYGFLAPWLHGVPVLVKGGRFDADGWCRALEQYKVSVWYSAPTAWRMIIEAGPGVYGQYDLSSVRHLLSTAEPLTEDVQQWCLDTFGVPVYDTWWMSETGMNMICNLRCLDIKPGSIGRPVPGVKAAVVDDAGQELPPNRVGNLAVQRGWPAMARDVWSNHDQYREYFQLEPWFISGDAAYMDEDGYFYFQGRVDGMINTAGERVSPWEVEEKLREHPAVKDAGVAGKADKIRGQIIKAYVVLEPGQKWSDELELELRNFVKNNLAAHAAPREFEVKESIPKTRDGQVDRKMLRGWVLDL